MKPLSQPASARVVCVCSDTLLRNTRQLVLSLRFGTVSVPRAADLKLLAAEQFDAVVLCHSLSASEFQTALELALRQWPAAEIIIVSFSGAGVTRQASHVVRTGSGPEHLLNTVDHLLNLHRGAARSAPHSGKSYHA